MTADVLQGDALALPVADGSVDLVVTSPPYLGLRSYKDGGEHYEGQIGAEATPAEFVDALIAATREMVRVLKPSGSIFVNLGDKYRARGLLALPWRYAIRCVDDLDLTLRAEVVWSKPNAYIDAKAAGRARRTHETWLHLAPSAHPFENVEALRQAPAADYQARPQYRRAMQLFEEAGFTAEHMEAVRAVGIIDSEGGAVRSGGRWSSRSGVLAAEVQNRLRSYYRELCGGSSSPRGTLPGSVWEVPAEALKLPAHLGVQHFAAFPMEWPRRFIKAWCPPDGVVLDPFGGTGTTATVAHALGRHGITVDLSHDYCRVAQWRTADERQLTKARG